MDILFLLLFITIVINIYLHVYFCKKEQKEFCKICNKNTCHKTEIGLYDLKEFGGGYRTICKKCNSDNTNCY